MYKSFRLILLSLGLFILSAAMVAEAGELDEIKRVQQGLRTVKAKFTQTKTTELLGRPIKSSGTFAMKAGAGVRWDYKDSMIVIYDGSDLYLHYTELDEAERISGASGFAGPLVFDIKKLLKNYRVTAMPLNGNIRLTLIPKKEMPFEQMEMTFPNGSPFPDEVVVMEQTGDKTVIRFTDIKLGASLPDSLFVFDPPFGVKVRHRSIK